MDGSRASSLHESAICKECESESQCLLGTISANHADPQSVDLHWLVESLACQAIQISA